MGNASKGAWKERVEVELAIVDELKAAAPKDVAKRYERAGTNGS